MVSDHELVSLEVDPPVLPAEVEAQALATSREKALTMSVGRRLLLQTCAVEVERYAERLFWSGPAGAARTSPRRLSMCAITVLLCRLLSAVS